MSHPCRLSDLVPFSEQRSPSAFSTALFLPTQTASANFSSALADLRAARAEVIEIKLGIDGTPVFKSTLEIAKNYGLYDEPDFAEGITAYMSFLLPDSDAPKSLAKGRPGSSGRLRQCIK
ncbi:hypothetical protein BJ878DRAFT_481618 [Calycina marina]|uniref:Uncharacterized protein n=1 Tax=Calycina marina TaxID=1763456 RepID=A0A9P7Z008_9HELO|nr:hypothetical protein BJ878DRAFT_481618 [Calycina marina]